MNSNIRSIRGIRKALTGLDTLEKTKEFGISNIRRAANIYFEAYTEFYNKNASQNMRFTFTKADLLWFQTIAISVFLERWLENDQNARQTIAGYTKKPYVFLADYRDKEKGKAIRKEEGDLDKAKEMRKAKKVYDSLMERRYEQADDEHSPVNPQHKAKAPNANRGQKPYSFIELCTLDMWSNSELSLVKLWCFGQKPSNQSALGWLEDSFQSTYSSWHNTLTRIHSSYEAIQSMGLNDKKYGYRKYVAECMSIRKLEQSFRFGLVATISAILTKEKPQNPPDNYSAACYWGRYTASEDSFVKWNDNTLIRQNLSYDVGSYYEKAYAVLGGITPETQAAATKYRILRDVLIDFLDLLTQIYPVENLPHWTDSDFIAAAEFYHYDYPFIQDYISIPIPPDNKNGFFTYCSQQFVILDQMEYSPLRTMRNCFSYDEKPH